MAKAEARRVSVLEHDFVRVRQKLTHAEHIIAAQKNALRAAGLADGRGSYVMKASVALAPMVGIVTACENLGASSATFYRARLPVFPPCQHDVRHLPQ